MEKIEKKLRDMGYKSGRDKLFVLSWSMGTLLAQNFVARNWVDKLILACTTSDFCATTKPALVKRMIKNLKKDKEKCLKEFLSLNFKNSSSYENYIEDYFEYIFNLDDKYLIQGLEFLLSEKLLEYKSLNRDLKPLVLIAENDSIIVKENSMNMIAKLGGDYIMEEFSSGHNIFYEAHNDVVRVIRGYLNDN
jgi:pimeloyl-ACP methyl ester carboxylesterase